MKKLVLFAVATTLIGAMSTSCIKRSINGKIDTTDSISLATYSDSVNYHLLGKANFPSIDISVSLQYPYPNDTSASAIKTKAFFLKEVLGEEFANLSPEMAIDSFIKDNIDGYKNDIESMFTNKKTKPEAWMNYITTISTDTKYNKDGIWSFVSSSYTFTGGAHGLSGNIGYIYDTYDNVPITLNDIFITDSISNILNLIKKEVKQIEKKSGNNDVFWFDNITVSENIIAEKDGITWIYNPYEIAPYYVGITEVTIPYDSLKEYIRQDAQIKSIYRH